MEGKVKFFNRGKGFGFIQGDDGKDYFVHSTALKEGVSLQENSRVSFEAVEGDRGLKADNVQLIADEASPKRKASDEEDEDSDSDSEEETESEETEE